MDMISLFIFNVKVIAGNIINVTSGATKTRTLKDLTSGCV
jgi:hypothetical protein